MFSRNTKPRLLGTVLVFTCLVTTSQGQNPTRVAPEVFDGGANGGSGGFNTGIPFSVLDPTPGQLCQMRCIQQANEVRDHCASWRSYWDDPEGQMQCYGDAISETNACSGQCF